MGYYTRYKLTSDAPYLTRTIPLEEIVAQDKRHLLSAEDLERVVQDTIDPVEKAKKSIVDGEHVFEVSCKWYDHETDMRRVSQEIPDVVFTLTGEGEESGDMWAKHFKNGLMQKVVAQITYEPFDESKLV